MWSSTTGSLRRDPGADGSGGGGSQQQLVPKP